MLRTLLSTMSALALLAAACGDDKGTTTDATTDPGTGSTGTDGTTGTPDPTTGTPDPTTGEPGTTTGTPDPTTGEPDTTTMTVETTGEPGTTTLPGTTTIEDTTAGPDTTTGDPVQQCIDMVMGDACGTCACENCFDQFQACQMDRGCVAIRDCALETGCMGLGCLQECGDVIDMYGGLGGESAMKGLALSMCIDGQCADAC